MIPRDKITRIRFQTLPICRLAEMGTAGHQYSHKDIVQAPYSLEYAAELSKITRYQHDRDLRKKRLEEIGRLMESGAFRFASVALARLKFDYHDKDGKAVRLVRVNGGHTLAMMLEKQIPLVIEVEYHDVISSMGLSNLYTSFDSPSPVRTNTEQAAVFIDMLPGGREVWKTNNTIKKCATASAVTALGMGYRSNTNTPDRCHILTKDEYYPHAEFVCKLLFHAPKGITVRHLTKEVSVMSTILQTHMIDPKASAEFWTKVRDGAGLDVDCPEYKLREFLLNASVGNTKGGGGRKSYHDEEVKSICHLYWNARRTGKTSYRHRRIPQNIPELV
jgi:hypothetical protein